MFKRILENRKRRSVRPTTGSGGTGSSSASNPVVQTHIYQTAMYSNDDSNSRSCSSHSYSSSHSHDSGSSSGDSGGGYCD
ncbi:TPA: hypothetical protein QC153_002108 [Bacillus cereus]|nr:hypothetical protein [Bacillus cereus]